MAATMLEIKSATGMLYHMPSIPQYFGKINRQGRRNSNCRLSDMNMALPTMPMLWKKLAVTIWNPIMGYVKKTICNPFLESAINSLSLVNMEAIASGKKYTTKKPNVVTPVAKIMDFFNTSFTLL